MTPDTKASLCNSSSCAVKTGDGRLHLIRADGWELSGNGLVFKKKDREIAWFFQVEWFIERDGAVSER